MQPGGPREFRILFKLSVRRHQLLIPLVCGAAVNVSSILLKSLVGLTSQANLSISLKQVDINQLTPADVWAHVSPLAHPTMRRAYMLLPLAMHAAS